MRIVINLTDEEKEKVLVEYASKFVPSGYTLKDKYISMGEFTFEKIEDEDNKEDE